MRALLQRVRNAKVVVDDRIAGAIGPGLLVLAAAKQGDEDSDVEWIAEKIAKLRLFGDAEGKMNLSVTETGGEILLVSQFTLYGDIRKGRRPSFTDSARPEEAVPRLDALKARLEAGGLTVRTGEFGAHMEVELLNEGPVTLMLDSEVRRGRKGTGDADADRLHLLAPESALHAAPLVLASASPRRRDLLRDLGVRFTVQPSGVEETVDPTLPPGEQAERVAARKAAHVADRLRECLILAADTIVVRDGRVFGKPADREEAIRMLRALAGGAHEVVTGVCVAHRARDLSLCRTVRTRVVFRAIRDEEIRRYVDTGEPFGKAGAYAIQGLGGLLVSGIDGDYSNVVGLPLGTTLDLLEEATGERGVGGGVGSVPGGRSTGPGKGPA